MCEAELVIGFCHYNIIATIDLPQKLQYLTCICTPLIISDEFIWSDNHDIL